MKNKAYIPLFIISILFLGIGGTLAALTASGVATNITQIKSGNLTMTVDSGESSNVALAPGTCTSEYAIKKTINASAVNTSGGRVSFSIGMNITTLGDGLKRSTMRYALTTSATSCTDGLIASGNFADKTAGSDVWLIKNDYDNITKSGNNYNKKYYLYIWLDSIETQFVSGNISVTMKGTSSNNPNLETESSITFYDIIRGNADTTTQIDFNFTSEGVEEMTPMSFYNDGRLIPSNLNYINTNTNINMRTIDLAPIPPTNGIYTTTSTDTGNPVYYYRGNVDNRLIFANFCWRIVRTTETGGVKIIYDGVPREIEETVPIEESSYTNVNNDATYPYTFDTTNKTWTSTNHNDSTTSTITFSVATAGDYTLNYILSSEEDYDEVFIYKNDNVLISDTGEKNSLVSLPALTTTDVIKVEYVKDESESYGNDNVSVSIRAGETIFTCDNTGVDTTIGNADYGKHYSTTYSSVSTLSRVGYMYGAEYYKKSKSISSLSGTIVFGNNIIYSNGTYTLTDTYTVSDMSNWSSEYRTVASRYHYTCFTDGTTCTTVSYSHMMDSYDIHYYDLTGGKNHLDILSEMLDNSSNTTNSGIKTTIDNWYQTNLSSYTSQLEDTVFCNDRSYDVSGTGWDKDSSALNFLPFNSYRRLDKDFTLNTSPTLVCHNANDKFTISTDNGNGKLTYPVGLITADEIIYAGANGNETDNESFYLNVYAYIWSLSPSLFHSDTAYSFFLKYGILIAEPVGSSLGVRPVVSLKPGIAVSGGTGTATDPYIVG